MHYATLPSTQKEFNGKRRRCERNRKRSKRRAICCPIHNCYLDSISQKFSLYTDRVDDLTQRGVSKRKARLLVAKKNTVILQNEWLEAFWCRQCEKTEWYHVKNFDRNYQLSVASKELWQRAVGVSQTNGNPSVGEFTRRQSRMLTKRDY